MKVVTLEPRTNACELLRALVLPFAVLLTLGQVMGNAQSNHQVVVYTEKAPSPDGPWQTVFPAAEERDPHGNPVFPVATPAEFYRARIGILSGVESGLAIPLETVDPEPLGLAQQHLDNFRGAIPENGSGLGDGRWENPQLAPFAYPVYEPHINQGESPAYLEFKVIRAAEPQDTDTSFLKNYPVYEPSEIGYILVSLTDQDIPVPEFATAGSTPVEQLARLAGRSDFRPIRFGSTFLAAEGFDGELLANWGAQPFKPDPEILATVGFKQFSRGNDDTGEYDHSPEREHNADGYRDYQDFRTDYMENPVYLHLRDRRVAMARPFWKMLREGQPPDALEVATGETIVHWGGIAVREFYLTAEEEETIARVVPAGVDLGLQITGVAEGQGVLHMVGSDSRIYQTLLRIVPADGRTNKGDNGVVFHPVQVFYASSWAAGPKYHQYNSSNFCPLSGCGPTAWSILFGWFERERNVDGAFGHYLLHDAGYVNSDDWNVIYNVQASLHDLCDVICPPFSDQGATPPGDMFSGIYYLYNRMFLGVVKRSYHMAYDLDHDGLPLHGALCRNAIKNGRPAVVGLGWLWHYVMAYGYAYQKVEIPVGIVLRNRYIKCNMGWGPGSGPRWYSLYDTFWGGDINIWDGPNAD